MFATAGQAQIFLATVYAGIFTGLLYDMLSLLRHVSKLNQTVTGAIDIFFWIAAAAVFTTVIVFSGGDGLRGYMLLGFCSGLILYRVGIHYILRSLIGKTAAFIRKTKKRFTFVKR